MFRLAICFCMLLPTICHAYRPAPPQRHDVFSPNQEYVLDVDPKTEKHTIYAANDRSKPIWSFSTTVGVGSYFLSNDGHTVAYLSARFVRAMDLEGGSCIKFWNKDGRIWFFTLSQLCPKPARLGLFEPGPVGSFWRKWYDEFEQAGDTLRVKTTDLYEYTFSLADGQIIESQLIWANLLAKPFAWEYLLLAGGLVFFVLLRRWFRNGRMATGNETSAETPPRH